MKCLLLLSCAVALLGAACGGNVATTGSGGGTSSSAGGAGGASGTGGSGGSGGSGGGISGVNCSDSGESKFPMFDKTCATKSDCAIKLHQLDCCGSQEAIGVSQSDASRFDKDEKACDAMYPGCGCSGKPTTAEDGKNATMGTIEVACQTGKCMTFVQ